MKNYSRFQCAGWSFCPALKERPQSATATDKVKVEILFKLKL
jgi:hypothetical protein